MIGDGVARTREDIVKTVFQFVGVSEKTLVPGTGKNIVFTAITNLKKKMYFNPVDYEGYFVRQRKQVHRLAHVLSHHGRFIGHSFFLL